MSKKVKCVECSNVLFFGIQNEKINKDNYEDVKKCLEIVKRKMICDVTMREKSKDNEQYCEHFEKCNENDLKIKEFEKKKIEQLETKIKNYEKTLED